MENHTQAIGYRLRVARISAGYKYAKHFADEFNIPLSTFSQHERGGRSAPIDVLMYYSELLKVNPTWLITGEGSPYASNIINSNEQKKETADHNKDNAPKKPTVINFNEMHDVSVDLKLFLQIFSEILDYHANATITPPTHELIDFALDIYNNIITTSADEKSRLTMIKLSIGSLQRGAKVHHSELSITNLKEKIA